MRSLRAIRHEAGYLALRGVLGGARLAPLGVLRAGGAGLGRLAMAALRRDRKAARAHLELAFPERGREWQEQVLRANAVHYGRLLGEIAWLWSAPARSILARTEIVDLQHLQSAPTPVLVTGHCGNWEWMNLALGAAGVPMSVAAREVYDPRLDDIARRLRGRFGGATELRGEGAGRRLAAAQRAGRVIGLLIDQDIDAPGAFVEFFGRAAWTATGAAVLALRLRCPIVTGFATRLADGRMRLAFDPPLLPSRQDALDDDAARLTARLTARIEAQIRAHPEQWVWNHRRWRRRPAEGERVWSTSG